MHFNAYPELHKHARSLLLYFEHNLGTGTRTALTNVVADVISGLLSLNVNKISRKLVNVVIIWGWGLWRGLAPPYVK